MTDRRPLWKTHQKLAIFRRCFTGLTDVYGTYDPQTLHVRQVKQPVTDRVLLDHLEGRRPYGVYLLVGHRTKAVVADLDEQDPCPPLEFVRQARQYGLAAYVERSKRKGWHAWIFFDLPGVRAAKARSVARMILADISRPSAEVFPKQDRLEGNARYGNFINAPLFGRLLAQGRTVFVDPGQGLRPCADQWELLANVERVSERRLDDIIEINGSVPQQEVPAKVESPPISRPFQCALALTPCARRMLADGVRENQRTACFRLAVQLKKAGLTRDVAIGALTAWVRKNRPADGRRVLTHDEIVQQTGWAYARPYHSCGCEDPAVMPYCHPSCPLKRSGGAQSPRREGPSASNPM